MGTPLGHSPEPDAAALSADALSAIASVMERMADALGRLADSQEDIASRLEDLGTKIDEVIATLNSGIDVAVSHPVELEPVIGQRLVPELHFQVSNPAQIPMVMEAIRRAEEGA